VGCFTNDDFRVLSQYLPREPEETYTNPLCNPCPGRFSNRVLSQIRRSANHATTDTERSTANKSASSIIVSVKLNDMYKLQTIKHTLRYYIVYHRDNFILTLPYVQWFLTKFWIFCIAYPTSLFVVMTSTCMRIVKPIGSYCFIVTTVVSKAIV
jgi:hypothetical protein